MFVKYSGVGIVAKTAGRFDVNLRDTTAALIATQA
jgi:hypothetical protein